MIPPDELPLWTVAVDIGLGEIGGRWQAGRPSLHHVGACGFSRGDTLIRGAGEAVERAALIPPAVDPLRLADVPPDDNRRLSAAGALAHPILNAQPVACLPAIRLGSPPGSPRRAVLVPAAIIDDPVREQPVDHTDASPSGAASGPSLIRASLNAFLECVERDAVQAAWTLGPALRSVDPASFLAAVHGTGPRTGSGQPYARSGYRQGFTHASGVLAKVLRGMTLLAGTALIPCGIPGITVALTMLVDEEGGGIAAAGSCASWSLDHAVLVSAREALQVLSLLRKIVARWPSNGDGGAIVDEISRALFWASPAGAALGRDFLERCELRSDRNLEGSDHNLEGEVREGSLDDDQDRLAVLASHLCRDGLDPLICDLTGRLPPPLREMGWHAVRGIVVGHQPLRMNETYTFTWAEKRLLDHARRWGVTVPADLTLTPPHPLI
ncbi:YcaO-like family protein [Frankia sp. Cppng1_Ct_nod]|uniref:YcaO-like family protein n=1 Tax=Frankia sp. Cppng1_Ct_nod TaxID=2897162 RepID=UPI0020251FBC|nr:YcaO-like family protein [Frankia sp. Cppng1_Ct_nod]